MPYSVPCSSLILHVSLPHVSGPQGIESREYLILGVRRSPSFLWDTKLSSQIEQNSDAGEEPQAKQDGSQFKRARTFCHCSVAPLVLGSQQAGKTTVVFMFNPLRLLLYPWLVCHLFSLPQSSFRDFKLQGKSW